jgi:PhnB protein
MSAKSIPDGYDALIPSIIVRDAAKAIEFYKKVFGATEKMRMPTADGSKIAHAEIKIRDHVLMLGDECPSMGALAPQDNAGAPSGSVMIYVPDVDAVYNKGISMGAKAVMPPMDMFWGDRFSKFIDPFGHQWGIATHTKDVSPEECAKAAAEWAKSQPA